MLLLLRTAPAEAEVGESAVTVPVFRTVSTRQESAIPVDEQQFTLPSGLRGDYSWIGAQSIATHGSLQYVVWVGPDRKARIARRQYNRAWEPSIDLSAATGTVLGDDFDLDSHNTVVVHVDDQGYVHVAGNMHADPLLYMHTTRPGILTEWTSGMVGTLEASATYPQFVVARNGITYFWYRDGSSGDGDWVLNRWDSDAFAWTRVAVVLQGAVENVSAYPQNI